VAGQAPAAPTAPTLTTQGVYIKIDWAAPADNSYAIDAYQVLIETSASGVFAEDLTSCDGSDPTILS